MMLSPRNVPELRGVMLGLALTIAILASQASAHAVHPLSLVPAISRRSLIAATLTTNISSYDGGSGLTPIFVSWTGVTSPSTSDIVALYVPASARDNTSSILPVQIQSCAQSSPTYLTTGSGSFVFHLANFRADVGFVLFRNCSGCAQPVAINGYEALNLDYGPYVEELDVAAISAVVRNTNPNRPSSGTLTITASSDKVTVQWVSASNTPQSVQWGISPSIKQMVGSRLSIPDTYSASQMCGSIASNVGFAITPGFIHSATIGIKGLKPNKKVYYRYGSDAVGWSSVASFLVPPAPGDFSVPLKFIGAVDIGVFNPGQVVWINSYTSTQNSLGFTQYASNASKLVPFLLRETSSHLFLLPGDISYAQGFAADWDVFGAQFEQAFRMSPVAIAMGNHERNWAGQPLVPCCGSTTSQGECGVPALFRYSTPATGLLKAGMKSKGNNGKFLGPLVYSFSRGPVHFITLDTEMDSSPGSVQRMTVEADLALVNRSVTPWLFISMHRFLYDPTDNKHDIANAERLQSDWEALFLKYKVDLVFAGHTHSYARTCPIFNGTCCSSSLACPVYVVAGNAGSGFTDNFPPTIPSIFTSAIQYKNGYTRWTATPKTLSFQMISTDNGAVLDSLLLSK